VSDEFTVPIGRTHHRELHRSSNEPAWWTTVKIDPLIATGKLWRQSRDLPAIVFADDAISKTKPETPGIGARLSAPKL
jgi:hypothetical protein